MTIAEPSTPTVLIATADEPLAACLTQMLTERSHATVLLDDGLPVLKLLTGPAPPHIALIDIELPSIDGMELAAQVKRRTRTSLPWLMLMSSTVDPEVVKSAAQAGIDDLLVKPIDIVDLQVRLGVAQRFQHLASQLEAQIDAATFNASHDNLTGMWNREALLTLLFPETDRVQRLGTPLSLILLDLDRFSSVNLDYGYSTGDKILRELAARFRRFLRSYDLIGRYGEDEFLIALPGCTIEQALFMAQRLRKSVLGRPFSAGADMLGLTASMGIAQSRGRSPLVVLREAERALADAKIAGRNRVCRYFPSTSEAQLTTTDAALPLPAPAEN
jgi:two-component system, cell cycle response regulator